MKNSLHEQVFQFCEEHRKVNPEFVYWLRVRNGKNRLDNGIWFQGTEKYASVGLYNSRSGNHATKGFALLFFEKAGIIHSQIEILFKTEKDPKIIAFYKDAMELIGGFEQVNETHFKKSFDPNEKFRSASEFLKTYKDDLDSLVRKHKVDHIIMPSDDFLKRLDNIMQYRTLVNANSSIKFIVANITWNSNNWRSPSDDKSGHRWVSEGNMPHESWNFDFDNPRNTDTHIYGYAQFTNAPKVEGDKNLVILYSSNNIVGFYGKCHIFSESQVIDSEQSYNLKAPKEFAIALENHIPDIKENGFLEEKQRVGMVGFTYLKDHRNIERIITTAIELNPILENSLRNLLHWVIEESKVPNYWVFQGNPKHFDIVAALNDNALRSWSVTNHKTQIKKGDKVILWVTGENSGCYALCTVGSDVRKKEEELNEQRYYRDTGSIIKKDRVKLIIDHNLCDAPLDKNLLLENPVFKSFPGGKQGTNFKTTKEQYETILNMIEQKPTTRFWLYAPGRNAMYWDEFYENNIMCVGDDNLGNLMEYSSKEKIRERLKELSDGKSESWNDALTLFNLSRVMQPGDIVIAKRGRTEYLGYGVVASDYYFDETRDLYNQSRRVEWKSKEAHPESGKNIVLKTLTDITPYPDYVSRLKELWNIQDPEPPPPPPPTKSPLNLILYGPPGTGKTYHTVNEALKIIDPDFDLTQPRAKVKMEFNRLVGEGRIVFATFHQSMSYEDFVEGIKPVNNEDLELHYDILPGVFKQLSTLAMDNWLAATSVTKEQLPFEESFARLKDEWEEDPEMPFPLRREGNDFTIIGFTSASIRFRKASGGTSHTLSISTLADAYYERRELPSGGVGIYYPSIITKLRSYSQAVHNSKEIKPFVLIIDEINRGNVSQIFGELITLIESDKRAGMSEALEVVLPYSKQKFSVPPNLHIIGTMNTADRSVEALDTALRRRFSFKEMPPRPELIKTEGYLKGNEGRIGDIDVVKMLETINKRLERLIDKDHCIGHSYFMHVNTKNDLEEVFKDKVIPLLQEYFFGDFGKIGLVLGNSFVLKDKETQVFASFAEYGDSKQDLAGRPVYSFQPPDAWDFKAIYQVNQ